MFTGIVEELGALIAIDGNRLRIAAGRVLEDVELGASIAVNGCCLTVVAWEPPPVGERGWWDADVSDETFSRTALGRLRIGDPVNLERPVRLDDRMGGHLVQGHVDAVGTVRRPVPELEVALPRALTRYIVEKGSIAVDGVSLTVVDALVDGFTAAVIPHTCEVTTLGHRGIDDEVNIEVDVMAKYTESLITAYLPGGPTKTATLPVGGSDEEEPDVS